MIVFAEASTGQPFSSDEIEKSSNVGMKGFKKMKQVTLQHGHRNDAGNTVTLRINLCADCGHAALSLGWVTMFSVTCHI